jgi:hypothetical protein
MRSTKKTEKTCSKTFTRLLQSTDFMPHGHCYLWNPTILWMHVVSDTVITLSYYAIPIVLTYFIFKKQNVPFNWLVLLFALFILGCGTTHLMEIINVWKTEYALAGIIKVFTAVVSILTAILLIPVVPKLLAIDSFDLRILPYDDLQQEILRLRDENRRLTSLLNDRK